MRKTFWKFAGRTLDLSRTGAIMGVLNVTPDSFSDPGEFFPTEHAVEQALRMESEGAQIIDIGGESTRPDAKAVSASEECARILPVLQKLRGKVTALISIDTSKAEVAEAALHEGASIVNDVTGGRRDASMMPLVARTGAGFIIMHMQGTPRTMQKNPHYNDVVAEVRDFFRQQYRAALESGIDPMAIAFDPGIGFGKTLAHNLDLLRHLRLLGDENRPIVVGVSRKSFLAKIIDSLEMKNRLAPTVALTALLRQRGANVIRVHDVKDNVAALRVTEALMDGESR
ncbi:MAG: dihydropteroate synthase [Chthoniobacterales bacterium]